MRYLSGKILGLLIGCCCSLTSLAQSDPISEARSFAAAQDYPKAIDAYKKLYDQSPLDMEVYREYLTTLLSAKEYKQAQELAEHELDIRQRDPMILLDLGKVFLKAGKDKKAHEQFDKALLFLNGDDLLTTQMGEAFTAMDQPAYAIKVYERAIELIHAPYLYSKQLARLYARINAMDKAIDAILTIMPGQMPGADDTQTLLLELLGNDPQKLQLAQKAFIKKINEQPDNTYYSELLTWLYTQKNDWDGALIQIQAIDERNKENGQRMLEFARDAAAQHQFAISLRALDAILENKPQSPMDGVVKAEQLNIRMQQLKENPLYKPEEVKQLEQQYQSFFEAYPQYYNTETLRDYALLEAQYAGNAPKGVTLLEKALEQPGARRDFAGWAKLQLGDYYVLDGRIWDASLAYSQVDKEHREDLLGEEARFRNARLAYYRGDFEWAQGQLSVLKASTSELIANDALYLSILITENIPPDSNLVPLRRFAYADLLLFQNRDAEAEQLLDSISKAFPKHPLNDDILMLRAKLATRRRDYSKALEYLGQVYGLYSKDVLADDAVFKTAELYELYLKKPDEARKYYEQLIIDYPGSTYVQTARQKLAALQNGKSIP